MMETWPELPYDSWKDTRDTLHMWFQIVGKVKLELCPFLNQWWEVAFLLTSRGLTTGLIPWRNESFSVDFDFIDHRLVIQISDGQRRELTLEARSVAEFYRLFMEALKSVEIEVKITMLPAEVANPVRFDQDTGHASYSAEYVQRWWRVMLAAERVIEEFRQPFHGKSSPVQFFWGGFDLDHTRFNGKAAPPPGYGGTIMEYGEDAENFAVGFWPGSDNFPKAAFYSYMSPAPKGVADLKPQPAAATFDAKMGEFILLYEDVRKAANPAQLLIEFFQSTYEASAQLASWDRATLEGHVPPWKAHPKNSAA